MIVSKGESVRGGTAYGVFETLIPPPGLTGIHAALPFLISLIELQRLHDILSCFMIRNTVRNVLFGILVLDPYPLDLVGLFFIQDVLDDVRTEQAIL